MRRRTAAQLPSSVRRVHPPEGFVSQEISSISCETNKKIRFSRAMTQRRESGFFLLTHYLKNDLSVTISGIAFHQRQILPWSDRNISVYEWNRNERRQDRGFDVT